MYRNINTNNMYALECLMGIMYFTRMTVLYGNASNWNGCERHRGEYVIEQYIECN